MKIFLALLILFAYAAEFSNPGRSIERASSSRFSQLDSDTFYCIMTFLRPEEVFDIKFLSRGFYERVRKIWPKMELYTVMRNVPHPQVSFSHVIEIDEVERLENQAFFYDQVQLKYLRKFKITRSFIHDLQLMINLLPKNSLISLKLDIEGPTCPLISNIDFPKLTHLGLSAQITLNHVTFNSLPSCMEVLKVNHIFMDNGISSSLATRLEVMNSLEVFSLFNCSIPKYVFFVILKNLPISLKSLNIDSVYLYGKNIESSELGLKRVREMKCLQKISFWGLNDEITTLIILNLPKCVTNIKCFINRKTLNVFKERGELTDVRRIESLPLNYELIPDVLEIFPNLDKDIRENLCRGL